MYQTIFKHFRISAEDGKPYPYNRPHKRGDEVVPAPFRPTERGGLTVCVISNGDGKIL